MTAQQARDYNILLEIKERVESKYKDKNRINIINKKPRIIFMSNIEENKISDEAKQRAANYVSLKSALEPKQETLEEAMRRNGYHDEVNDTLWREGVKFGAKWQQERMYSEEEVLKILLKQQSDYRSAVRNTSPLDWSFDVKKWFKQFKKK